MSYFGLADVSSVNTLFSSLGGSSSSTSSGSSILADYASIRSGSYYKLLKAYYSSDSDSTISKIAESSTSTSKDSAKKLTSIESAGEDLKESVDALITNGTNSVFKQVTTKAEDGTTTTGYQTEAIYKKVNAFVEDYNNLIEATEDINTGSVTRRISQMIRLTDSNEKSLSDIGITVNSDNTLSIDKDTFLASDMSKVKNLFNGTASYAYNVGVQASMVDYYAQYEASKANTYNSSGSYNYNYSYGSNYSNYI